MKTIFVVRHADAVNRKADIPDFERPLVKKGIRHAKDVSRRMRKASIVPDLLISSPAKRAVETAHVFARAFRYPLEKILLREELYKSDDPDDFLRIIRGQRDEFNVLLVFGHDPALSAFAGSLAAQFRRQMPKTAVVGVQFEAARWSDVAAGGGTLVYFDHPMTEREQTRLHKEITRHLSDRISATISESLLPVVEVNAGGINRRIKKASASIAEAIVEKGAARELVLRRLLEPEVDKKPEKKKKPRRDETKAAL
jgi:phosphohistidine phosphatase